MPANNPKASAPRQAVPLWRDVRVLRVLAQVVFFLLVVAVAGLLYANVQRALRVRGLTGGFDFLTRAAGFPIAEGIPYRESDPYWYAFWVGVVNTLKLSTIGIVLATLLGTLMGIARLSTNWLVNRLAAFYIEAVRNVPLLLQLFFWYFAVILKLPLVKESLVLPGPTFISNRGTVLPWLAPTASFAPWLAFVALAAVSAPLLWRWHWRRQERTGQPGHGGWWALAALTGLPALGWLLVPGSPLAWDLPAIAGLGYQGGSQLSPELTAMIVGLTVYTGSFIAEAVRAGIQAVAIGQKEAARALALSRGQSLRLVVLPQAMRLIIPPLTNQYLNLAKNSSLAIAVGFPDLFSIGQTIFNQTGRSVEVIEIMMLSYLLMSLFTSLVLNIYNRQIRLVER